MNGYANILEFQTWIVYQRVAIDCASCLCEYNLMKTKCVVAVVIAKALTHTHTRAHLRHHTERSVHNSFSAEMFV